MSLSITRVLAVWISQGKEEVIQPSVKFSASKGLARSIVPNIFGVSCFINR